MVSPGPEVWMALGGGSGAFVRLLADQGVRTWSRECLVQTFVGFVSTGLLAILVGTVAPSLAESLAITTRSSFGAWLSGASLAYSGLDLSWLLRRRFVHNAATRN